ncbi:hypothetical protein SAMN05216464_104334 [Mucilaginibacter pineti]|uniref:Lipoprotein n=1 Tax=Mucilaginibacter pineti TaxID=1391627 RepID=A0A1G7AZZ4_9SPHI|nr:hypothetical protein [Mucilaginibacter pineti]SDE20438.1 hypothetical protein SAMN05216464_104334 [Mucilaginibacter pineti]
MKYRYFLILFTFFTILGACNQPISQTSKASAKKVINAAPEKKIPIDTSKAFKFNDNWVVPKSSLDFNSLGDSQGDTLKLAVCGDFVYSPFGTIKDSSAFSSSLLKNFSIVTRTEKMDNGTFNFQILNHGSSKLIFFFDTDPEASRHSDIFKGEIYDEDVQFVNGIRIGMSFPNFYKTLFDSFPDDLTNNYTVVQIISCVDDIIQTYDFDAGKLKSVKFITDSYWKVDY